MFRRIAFAFAAFLTSLILPAQTIPDSSTLFNDAWKFARTGADASAFSFDDSSWRTVDLPHDWGVEGPFEQVFPGETGKLEWWGSAWYRKHLTVSEEDLKGLVLLDIDGAMSFSTVWVNGTKVGGRPYGYASFRTDLTEALQPGDNVIAVRLDNPENSSRWYPGGGIYRNVHLVKLHRISLDYNGLLVSTELDGDGARLDVRMILRNMSDTPGHVIIHSIVKRDYHEETLASDICEVRDVADGMEIRRSMKLDRPALWSPGNPEMYYLMVYVEMADTGEGDIFEAPFGVRSAEWKADGFYLNGERTFLKGVCLHHDAGAIGAVWNKSAWIRRLNMLKDMGCNAIRTSHNPPAPELLNLCDRMGFLVMDELTDTWTIPKKPNGYASIFDEWAEKDLVDFIHRDYNHPSVILWSIGNECDEQGYADKWDIPRRLTEICHREDPTRLVSAGNNNLWASTQDYRHTIDVYGFNYKPHAYEEFRDANPGKPFFGSETASCVSTRGYYLFPVEEDKGKGWIEGEPFQVSSYDLYAPGWASKPDYEWTYEDLVPECAGEFVWTGFDYLGEPTPYNVDWSILTNFQDPSAKAEAEAKLREQAQTPPPSRSSYFGIIDLAGFPKDRYYIYQARWRPEVPMAHILPHWTWPGREGQVTPVHVYTSGDSAELFVNGKSMGRKSLGKGEYRLRWDDVVYQPGKVEVVAYKDGAIWAEDEVVTTGSPAHIGVSMEKGHGPVRGFGGVPKDNYIIGGDYVDVRDLLFFDIRIVDASGRIVPTADNLVSVKISGPAELVFTDSGDPTSHTSFKSPDFKLLAGLGSFGIRLTGNGKVKIKVRSKGLTGCNYILEWSGDDLKGFAKIPMFNFL